MMSNQTLNKSFIILLIQVFYKRVCRLEQGIANIYQGSLTHRIISSSWKKILACIKFSFIGKISELKKTDTAVLINSKAIQYFSDFFSTSKDKIILYLNNSEIFDSLRNIKKEFIFFPIRTVSFILIPMNMIYILLSVVLQKEISLRGWILLLGFLFIGISGLSCKSDWQDIFQSSLFLKCIKK